MVIKLNTVQPGDLITAEAWNTLVAALEDHERRITALEALTPGSTGKLQIASLSFPGPALHMGDELHILGVNFGLPGETVVSFGALGQVTQFLSMSDREIVLKVPSLSIGGPSLTLTLLVSNPRTGGDAREITLYQAVPTIPDGTILVGPPVFPAGNINPPEVLVSIPIKVNALNLEEGFSILPAVTPATISAVVLDENNQTISRIVLPKTDPPAVSTRTLKLRVAIPSGLSGPASIALTLTSERNNKLIGAMAATPFTIGQPAPVNAFPFKILGVTAGSYEAPPANLIHAPSPGPAKVRFSADLSAMPGNGERYTISAKLEAPIQGWTISTDTNAFTLSAPGPIPFQVWLTPTAGASATKLTVSITGTDPTHQSTLQFNVQPT